MTKRKNNSGKKNMFVLNFNPNKYYVPNTRTINRTQKSCTNFSEVYNI